jgi:SAM-dependent methyltransferase
MAKHAASATEFAGIEIRTHMNTDLAWEEWGKRDPYFGVITDPKFRSQALSDDAKREFFESGRQHADHVMQMIHQHIDSAFRPSRMLDFGCGVGRLVIPFAATVNEVTGLDVSPSMLEEARRNCDERGIANVKLDVSDDFLSALSGRFDLIHSFIVFQHIPPERGRIIFRKLLSHLAPGGVGALHFTYSKSQYSSTNGVPPRPVPSLADRSRTASLDTTLLANMATSSSADPEMQMNPYNATELLFITQTAGVSRLHAEFTDHGGELGIFLFFQKLP